jgi:hypothetical protein
MLIVRESSRTSWRQGKGWDGMGHCDDSEMGFGVWNKQRATAQAKGYLPHASVHLKKAHPTVSRTAAVKSDVSCPPAWPLWYSDNQTACRFNAATGRVAVQNNHLLPCTLALSPRPAKVTNLFKLSSQQASRVGGGKKVRLACQRVWQTRWYVSDAKLR